MAAPTSHSVPLRWWKTPEFLRSLPLFVLASVFFVAGGVLRFAYPTYALYGPGIFTFWALLLALGFTCTIGAVVSWTLAGEPIPQPDKAPAPAPDPAPAYLPIEYPEPASAEEPIAPARPVRARTDFGRPAPDVRTAATAGASGDWYEGPTDTERFAGPEHIVPIEVEPVSEAATESREGTEPVESVLADLERIERELAPRARVPEPSTA